VVVAVWGQGYGGSSKANASVQGERQAAGTKEAARQEALQEVCSVAWQWW